MVRSKRAISLLAGALIATLAHAARADDVATAEKLFVEGRRLMEEGTDYPAACAKFQAAHDLDPSATGTLLNLALCHEKIHRTATAWAEFRQVIGQSIGRREDRVEMARVHEARLAPLLSVVVVEVPPPARVAGLRVAMDTSRTIPDASWGIELPIDPGKHVVTISAPGKVSRSITITIGEPADKQKVEVPVLADAPIDHAPVGPPGSEPHDSGEGRRRVGYVLGGVGLAATAVGAIFGALALSKNSDADDAVAACPNGACPNEAARSRAIDASDDAKTNANIANVTIGVGVGLVVAGVVLVLTGRPSSASASSKSAYATQRPTSLRLSPRQSGFALAGEW